MKHVRVEATGTGNYLDPRAYLGLRCVKDLVLDALQRGIADGEDWLQLGFRHNCWKHEEDLSIRYVGLSTRNPDPADWTGFGPVTLDEILPHEHGCSHEIGFLGGSLTVVSRDLTATWTEADCPDK
ncbi:hypothetical protein [Amycolatopsis sp. NPDC004079]|uniref:hypothetical protein n=1 Tax=Amycolatopsis sp. NPDC004079 TaxID=3154549 RepID=UPI0033A47469